MRKSRAAATADGGLSARGRSPARGCAVGEVVCPNCGSHVPYTGAFSYALCPKCRTAVVIARARPVPASDRIDASAKFPSAADTDRPPPTPARPPLPYPLPSAHLIHQELPPPPALHIVPRVARAATAFGAGIVIFLLFNNLVTLALTTPGAFAYASAHPEVEVFLFVAFPFPIVVGTLTGQAAAVWHLVLGAAIVASLAAFLRRHLKDASHKILGILQGQPAPELSEPNPIFVMARVFSATALAALAVQIVALLAGQEPASPEGLTRSGDMSIFISLAHASVWEELATRVLLLGLPLLIIHYAGRGRLERHPSKYIFGGGFALDRPALALLVFSSSVFAVAHVPGWDLWKLPSTLVAGFGLGYLFLRYGLAAAICFHFLTDYLLASDLLFSENVGYLVLINLCTLALVIIGVANVARYLIVFRDILARGAIPNYIGGPMPEHTEAAASAPKLPATEPGPVRVDPER